MPSLIEMIRDYDVNHTKQLYTELYGKLLVPKDFFKEEFKLEESGPTEFDTLDITIQMPKLEVIVEEQGGKKYYIIYLGTEQLILLIKDKFNNWKDLVSVQSPKPTIIGLRPVLEGLRLQEVFSFNHLGEHLLCPLQ